MPRMVWRVVCGFEEVMATLVPTRAFVSVDLPVFGLPTIATNPERFTLAQLAVQIHSSQSVREQMRALPILKKLRCQKHHLK